MLEIIFLFVFGLIIGSFLGALTYRLPRNLSIGQGRSFCPTCHHQIAWFDNMPVLSYILLQAQCRNCYQKISPRYPLIEFSTGLVFVLVGLHLFPLVIVSFLIAIFVIDLEHQIIPDNLVFLVLFLIICNSLLHASPLIFHRLLGGFLAADALLFLNLITKGKGMGLGDVKLALVLGSLLPLHIILIWLFFSFVTGAVVGVILLMTGRAKLREQIAFGPFLIIGFALALTFGQTFITFILPI